MFVDDGNMFDSLDRQFFENIDFEDHCDISSVLAGKLKSYDRLMLFNEETVEVLGDIVGNPKFVQDVSRTGKLRPQFMDFV